MKRLVAFLSLAALCLLSTEALSQTIFTGAIGQDWGEAGNWTNGLPAPGNDAEIPLGLHVVIEGSLIIEFHINNYGAIHNNAFTDNYGDISNSSGGIIVNNWVINNYGDISNGSDWTSSPGTIVDGTIVNNWEINNYGTIYNYGIIENSRIIFNSSDGTIVSYWDIINYGAIINSSDGTIVNNWDIINLGGTLIQQGCTDEAACNFDAFATEDDGSCIADGICGWSEWGEWGPWSTDCGLATRTRTRECLVSGHCSGAAVETEAADVGDDVCGWSEWGEWGPWSTDCDLATRTRTRECLVAGHCAGSSIDTEIDESGSDVCGCTYENATNYDSTAIIEDGSCLYSQDAFDAGVASVECPPCANSDCPGDFTADGYIGVDDILSMLSLYDTSCSE